MNSFDRIFATINGTDKDRPALSLTLSLYGAGLISCPTKEYYSNAGNYIEGQVAVYEQLEPDVIFGPFSLPLIGQGFGSELVFFENYAPNLRKPLVKNTWDLGKIDFDKALQSKEIRYFYESIEGLSKTLGSKVPVAAIGLTPIDLPIMIMGLENWLDLILSDSKTSWDLIRRAGDFFLKVSNEMFRAGASFLILPAIFLNPRILTLDIAKQFYDYLADLFKGLKGPVILHEGGARMNLFLEFFSEIPNVVGFIVNRDDDLSKARLLLKKNQVLGGNLEGPELANMSEKELVEKVTAICKNRMNDPHFLFASAGADIPVETPLSKLKLIKKTLNEIYE